VEKPFAIINEAETKLKLLDFVSQTSKAEVQSRTFSDFEVNEGRWLLEATGNYLWHSYLNQTPTTKVVTLQVEVTNTISGTTIKMVGSSMTNVFNSIVTNAQNQITAGTEHLAGLDVEIVSVTAAKTVLLTRVAITNQLLNQTCNLFDHTNPAFWSMGVGAADGISSCANLILPIYAVEKDAFYPQLKIWMDMTNNGRQCRSTSPFVCLFETEWDTFSAAPTEYVWFNSQASKTVQIMDELEGQIFGVNPDPVPLKSSVGVGIYQVDVPFYHNYFAVNKAIWRMGPVFYW
jgi:hypothetical protein